MTETNEPIVRKICDIITAPLCNRCKSSPSWTPRWCADRSCISAIHKAAERIAAAMIPAQPEKKTGKR